MPVDIQILNIKCFNQLRNGEDFSQNASEYTPNLVGNVGEKVRLEYDAIIQVSAFALDFEEWYIDLTNNEITRDNGSFLKDGIRVGDGYFFYNDWQNRKSAGFGEYEGQVEYISGDGKLLRFTTSGTPTTSGAQSNVGIASSQTAVGNRSDALFLKFGLLGSDETFNYVSKVTESQQVYYVGGIGSSFKSAESLGNIKDWVSGEARVKAEIASVEFFGRQYNIQHDFIINPFYTLDLRESIDSGIVPTLFEGDGTLKYSAELEFRKNLSDTVSTRLKSFDGLDGFVGWYGENLNGLNPDYGILSIAYEDDVTGDPLDGININLATKVTIVVDKFAGAITSYNCGVYLIKLPQSEDEYIGTSTGMVENFLRKSETLTDPTTSNPNLTASIVGGDLVLEYTIDYSTAEKLRLTTDDEYMIMVQVEDPSTDAGDSDRIMLIADLRNYVDIDFLADFVQFNKYEFLQHGQTVGVDPGETEPITSDEDGILLDAVVGTRLSRAVLINSIKGVLVAYNPNNGDSFELDNFDFNLGNVVPAVGFNIINSEGSRGYPLPAGDEFNVASVNISNQDSGLQLYNIRLGQKIKWQEWLFNSNVPGTFYDSAQPQNNQNFKSSNYSDEQDYEIRLALILNVTGEDDLGRTITGDVTHYGGKITVNDYDESMDAVTGVIQTFDPDSNTSLDGDILYNGKDTLFRAVFQNATDMDYGIHRIEPSQSAGDGILELSSEEPSVANNLLKPLEGETGLKFDLVGSVLTTECLIDGSKIQEGVAYKLSARTGKIAVPPPAPSNLVATSTLGTDNNLTWTIESGGDETGFGIERSLDGVSGWVQIDTVGTGISSYDDETVDPFTEYYYRVNTLNGVPGEYSNVDNVTTAGYLEDSVVLYSPFSREILNFGTQDQLCTIRRTSDDETGSLEPLDNSNIIDTSILINTSDVGQRVLSNWIGANNANIIRIFNQQQGVIPTLEQVNNSLQPNIINGGSFPVVSGKPSNRFNGNDENLAIASATMDEIKFTRDFMIFVVVNNQVSESLAAVFGTNTVASNNKNFRLYCDRRTGSSLGVEYRNSLGVSHSVKAPATVADSNNHVYSITNNGITREMSLWVDGVAGDQDVFIAEPDVNDTRLRLGIDKFANFPLNGGVGLWCCYDVLDHARRVEVENYLINKFT